MNAYLCVYSFSFYFRFVSGWNSYKIYFEELEKLLTTCCWCTLAY